MLPIQMLQDARFAPPIERSLGSNCLGILILIFLSPWAFPSLVAQEVNPSPLSEFSVPSEATPEVEISAVPPCWTAEAVVERAIQADPLRKVLQHERQLAQSQRTGHDSSSSCAVQNWLISHLDQRISRREQELRAQTLKLHFGLAEVQSQTLVIDELHRLLSRYTELVEKVADAQEATDALEQKREELDMDIRNSESSLYSSLAQLRAQLRGLLPCADSQRYWPAEPLVVHFQEVDIEHQVRVAKQQRADISVWGSTPRIDGKAEGLAKIEQVLAANWWLVPTSPPNSPFVKLLIQSRKNQDLRRQWSIRRQQMQELARARTLEMETDVRMKGLALQQAYRSAEQAQFRKQQAAQRFAALQKRQEMEGVPLEQYWEGAFLVQRLRSAVFQRLGEARQAEIELDLATASQRAWIVEVDVGDEGPRPSKK